MAKLQSHHIILICWLIAGVFVILWPAVYYETASWLNGSEPITSSTSNGVISLTNSRSDIVSYISKEGQFQKEHLNEKLDQATKSYNKAQDKLSRLEKRISWIHGATPSEEHQLEIYRESVRSHQSVLVSIQQALELVKERDRSISPVFSQLAFEEARDLFIRQQSSYSSSSWTLFKYDVFWNAIFGRHNEDAMQYLVQLLLMLLWRLTFGVIIGVIDFMIRLPFYIIEYGQVDLHSLDESMLALIAQNLEDASNTLNLIDRPKLEYDQDNYDQDNYLKNVKDAGLEEEAKKYENVQDDFTVQDQDHYENSDSSNNNYKSDSYQDNTQTRKKNSKRKKESSESSGSQQTKQMYDDEFEWKKNVDQLMAQVNKIKMHVHGSKSSSWSLTLIRLLFWILWVAASFVAALVILALMFLPFIGCVYFLGQQRRQQDRNRR